MSVSSSTAVIEGSCNCGAVQISIPKSSFPSWTSFCHCINCRKSGSSLFSVNLSIPAKDVVLNKATKVYDDKKSISGTVVQRHFCGDCGSPVQSIPVGSETAYVKSGLFVGEGRAVEIPKPGIEAFWRSSEKWETPNGVKLME